MIGEYQGYHYTAHHNKEFQLSLKTEFIVFLHGVRVFQTYKEGRKTKQQVQQSYKKKQVVHMQPETQSGDSEAVCIQSKIQARD